MQTGVAIEIFRTDAVGNMWSKLKLVVKHVPIHNDSGSFVKFSCSYLIVLCLNCIYIFDK